MDRIYIVTDSTADIPPATAKEWDIHIVPCYINFGSQSFLDEVELSRAEFYRRLVSDPEHPTTSAPPSGLFARVYREILDKATGIVSLHPPDHLTALRQSALNGWEMVKGKIPYSALDAGQLSMGLGWIVIRAAQAAADGADMTAIKQLVAGLRGRAQVFAALDTIEFLRRSGRVGWARGAIGKILRIRPLIQLYQGQIFSRGYTRTRRSALERLLDHIQSLGELECLTVLHSNAPDLADEFRQRLAKLSLPGPILTASVTPVLGTHVGPGGVGFAAVQH